MERYDRYKDSGIEWIGEIPEHWQVCRISCLFSEEKRINSNLDNYHALKFMDGTIVPKPEKWLKEDIEETYSKYRVVSPGTIMINNLNLNFDLKSKRVGIVLENGIITSAYLALVPDFNSVIPSFYNYVFKGWDSRKAFHGMGSGLRKTLNWEELSKHKVVHPLIKEQRVIAEYLDRKTFEIDSLVQKTEKSIELLQEYRKSVITEAVTKGLDPNVPMKDSGVEWIGEIPEWWDLPKLKLLTTKIGSGKTPKGGAMTYSNSGVLFLRSQNVYNEGLVLDDAVFIDVNVDDEMSNTRVYRNDVLLNITGGSIGRSSLYELDLPANVNQHVCIIRPSSEVLPSFIHYYWISELGSQIISLYQTGANREGLNFEQIGNAVVPLPTLPEQEKIVEYLNQKTSEIDSLIEKKKQLVEKLQEYRKSLISECVTGKVKVPGVE